ncbi:hypothetical protein ABZU45_32430 [Streptomyces avermitilis]|uniref:hypothetical protein n=1 Tax=Streptomyces avermitilis TaxID=33903 RepID=UPI0033AA0C1D
MQVVSGAGSPRGASRRKQAGAEEARQELHGSSLNRAQREEWPAAPELVMGAAGARQVTAARSAYGHRLDTLRGKSIRGA